MENIKRNLKSRFLSLWEDPCKLFPVLGFVFTSLIGTLLHFLPNVLQNNFIYVIAPVNESVWEHLKLLFFPYLVFMIAEYFAYGRDTRGFVGAKARGILAGMAVIVAGYYIVTGILGNDVMWFNVLLFFIGTLTAYAVPYLAISRGAAKKYSTVVAIGFIVLLLIAFTVFTFATPRIGIFMDPETMTYGIN